ncbi:MAG: hypothetical protein HYR70_12105 [Chloroflexi bacterium]|nr:hypothetical protein [Chloroflexota bacterium]MBI3339373.1 hypothetical protein [Chloroflexota bacterium]
MTINIFLSVGKTATTEQSNFVLAVEELLKEYHLRPRTVGRTDFTTEKPLKKILNVMKSCSGTIVIAFERFNYELGTELRGSPEETGLSNVSLPTVWNQVEAGMAYALGHPILAIAESRLHNEGLLEDGYDWFIKWVDLTPASLHSAEFIVTFQKWVKNIERYSRDK